MRDNITPPPVRLNVVSTHGGLGDMIARLPAIRFAERNYPHVTLHVHWQDCFVELAKYLLPETPRLKHLKLSDAPYMLPKPIVTFDPERLTTLHLHLTKHAFLILMDTLPESEAELRYPEAKPVEEFLSFFAKRRLKSVEGSIVLTPAFTSKTRQWPVYEVNRLIRKLTSEGHSVALLGSTDPLSVGLEGDYIKGGVEEGLEANKVHDLINKTTLIEALYVMQKACAVVGVDNGLLHLAHCTRTPIVYGLTTLLPEHRLPYRNEGKTLALTAEVPCGGCQSKGFAVNQDWRKCMFSDYACTLTLTAERFYGKLKELEVI